MRASDTRRGVAVAFVGSIVAGVAGAQDRPAPPLAIHRVGANVYMLESRDPPGSNSAALIGDDGVLLVDVWGDPGRVRGALATLTDKPVRYVVATRCDSSENSRDTTFKGATLVASDNVRKRSEADKCGGWRGPLPTLTFSNELTLHFGSEEVRIVKLPTGVTDGDAIVYFKNANTLVTGDVFKSANLSAYSKYAGGDMLGVNEQLRSLVALAPENAKVIPSQGPESSLAAVRNAGRALDGIRDTIAEQVALGKTLEQIREMNLLEPWADLLGGPNGPNHLKSYYDCLTRPPDPAFQL
jgi:hypothetical protein